MRHRHIDGHDYFWALSEMLDNAREAIFIQVSLRVLSCLSSTWRALGCRPPLLTPNQYQYPNANLAL